MRSRIRSTASGLGLVTIGPVTIGAVMMAAVLAGCGGATVEGEASEVSSEAPAAAAGTTTPFAEERPEKPSGPVTPPATPVPGTEPMPGEPVPGEPVAEPAPELLPGDPAPPAPGEPAPPAPGGGDFAGLLQRQDVVLPEGVDPVATAAEACGRFGGGQQMDEVSGWLGEYGRLGPEQQGFFLGAAVGTYCPQFFPKLG
ncbi:DUF732 domain-containing protein [Rhodococcus sp. IEGM 1408]|uniref:DUF732 domain-containing protein n=1 Tax=Rhodococcus sp. IEGM 1408 TaxID=3082220 RepID=UPI002954E093|nr:DUF732 domain-containing protein [Rhodococcus sp. IEGM 1408]MDV8001910.1 DUF732 domain-containing protein [Rhodococcus sp. IEGM 1408]